MDIDDIVGGGGEPQSRSAPTVEVSIQFEDNEEGHTWFRSLTQAIQGRYPNAAVRGVPASGRPGEFEVTVEGTLVHSKLSTGFYPDANAVFQAIDRAGAQKQQSANDDDSGCMCCRIV